MFYDIILFFFYTEQFTMYEYVKHFDFQFNCWTQDVSYFLENSTLASQILLVVVHNLNSYMKGSFVMSR